MKIFCHNGIAPNTTILEKYGIKIQDKFEKNNEWENDAFIIELPSNLSILFEKDMPQNIAPLLGPVIINENKKIISSLLLSPVNYQYESENVPEDKMYDYHSFGLAKFYEKEYPSVLELETLMRQDPDKFFEIIEEIRAIPTIEKIKKR